MNMHHSDSFYSYAEKLKDDLNKCRIRFKMVSNLCGHRDGFDQCRFSRHTTGNFCKMENCPLLT